MSKTLTTEAAKHIAADHGLTITYNRSAKAWVLNNKNSNKVSLHPSAHTLYLWPTSADLHSESIDAFYNICHNIACNTISKDQMRIVVDRAVYSEWQDRLEMARLEGKEGIIRYADVGYSSCTLETFSADKQVHAMEDAITMMMEELTEKHGSYSDHKAAIKARIAALESEMQGEIADGATWIGSEQWDECQALKASMCKRGVDPVTASILANFGIEALPSKDAYTVACDAVEAAVSAVNGSEHGCALTLDYDLENGYSYVLHAIVGKDSFTHKLLGSVTSVSRLIAHWTGFVANIKAVRNEPEQAGFTEQYHAESVQYTLHLYVKPGTDFDTEFTAWCADEKEFIRVKGWHFELTKVEA